MLEWENETFGDIHMIDMEENMDDGKSYEYFASLAAMYPSSVLRENRPWDYAMKIDDDAFLHIPNLLEKLRPMTRNNTWFVLPLSDHSNGRVEVGKRIITWPAQGIFSRGI
jgi:hypothetical protein